jgi:hypothetical protein
MPTPTALLWNDVGSALRPITVGRIAWSSVEVVRQARDGCVVVAYRADDGGVENLVFWPGHGSAMTAASMVEELRAYLQAATDAPGNGPSTA